MQLAFDLDLPAEAAPTVKRARAPNPIVGRRRAEQLSLPGLPHAPIASLFLAICPDACASAEIDQRIVPAIKGAIASKIGIVPGECRHISMVGFGKFYHVAPAHVDKLDALLRELKAPAFSAIFDRLMTFGPRGAVVMTGVDCVAPLRDFHDRVCDALQLPRHFRNFTPHMTVARAPRIMPELEVPPVSWQVREFQLIHSLRKPYRHVIEARWPLAA